MHAKKIMSIFLVFILAVTPVAAYEDDSLGFFDDALGFLDDLLGIDDSVPDSITEDIPDVLDSINIDDILSADDIPSPVDQPAGWSALSDKAINQASADGTLVYENIYGQCRDPDGPELILVISSHPFTLYTDNNDLKIQHLNPAHSGQHTVVLDCNGVRASFQLIIVSTQQLPPIADAGPDRTANISELLTFDGSASTDPDGTITAFAWDFGDGTTATGRVVQHAFTIQRTFVVTLTVTDNHGLTDSDTAVVNVVAPQINQPPVANAGPDRTVNANRPVTFDGLASTDTDGTIVSFLWNFGDGTSSIGSIVQHIFTALGTFIVTLTVTDDDGATGTDTATIIADGRPTAVLNCPASTAPNRPIVLDASQSTDNERIVNYAFNFGDGTATTSTTPFVLHTYTSTGTFAATLTVTDNDALSDTKICTITVQTTPTPPEEVKRDRLVFSRIDFSEIARAGDTLEVSVTLANDGPKELKDTTITAFIYDLDVRATQGPFDLDNGDSETELLLLNLPKNAQGRYDIELVAGNEDVQQNTYRTITIR